MTFAEKKITVIVPVYNAEKTLKKCVDSLLSQTHKNMEIILVDDGSKDLSPAICDTYEKEDGRIKVFHKENGGSSSARNEGLRHATGDYVGFCDSDDYVEADMYASLLSAAEANPEGNIFQILAVYESESGEVLKAAGEKEGAVTEIKSPEMFRLLMLHLGDASFCTKLIKRDFMKDYEFPEGRLNEDFELLLSMIQKTDPVTEVEKCGYHIVLSDKSNTRGNFKPEFYNANVANSDMAYKLAEEKFPESLVEARRFQFYQKLDYLLHIPADLMKDNPVCDEVIAFLKEHRKEAEENPFLSEKEKKNIKILSRTPRLAKRAHGLIMRVKKPGKTKVYEGAKA